MKRNRWYFRYIRIFGPLVLLSILVLFVMMLGATSHKVFALPEYSVRTGESCAACHVNPGGGGPRTLRGLLWAARGRPDVIPELPGMLIAPRVSDGLELYEIACAGCHGYRAEGLSTLGLANTGISQRSIESFTLTGIPRLGMPGFEGQFTDDQLKELVGYVAGLSSGKISPPEDTFALPTIQFRCQSASKDAVCGGSIPEAGGN